MYRMLFIPAGECNYYLWPRQLYLQAIRSLCEIEYELDSISTDLGEQLAFERFGLDDETAGLDVRHVCMYMLIYMCLAQRSRP